MKRLKSLMAVLILLPVITVQILLCGCTPPVFTMCIDKNDNPQSCFEEFFRNLRMGNYDEADGYLANIETLGFEDLGGDDFTALLGDQLTSSRSASVLETVYFRGYNATLRIELTTLDFQKFEAALSEVTSQKAHDLQYGGQDISTDEQYEAVMLECANELLLSPQSYYTTKEFLIDFIKTDGEWKLICTDELYSALIGYSM